jgi:hypothetical protein
MEEGGSQFMSGPELLEFLTIASRDRKLWLKVTVPRTCEHGHQCKTCDDKAKREKRGES